MKNLIFVILGKSGAGKSKLSKDIAEKLEIKELVSTTSRPKRENEIDGIDYYFKSYEEMEDISLSNGFIEYTCYNGWYYGVEKAELNKAKRHSIVVVEPKGFKQFKKIYGDRVIPIYINTSDKNRLLRSLNREDNPNCQEICRRLLADTEDFKEIENNNDIYNIDNNGEYETTLSRAIDYISFKRLENLK